MYTRLSKSFNKFDCLYKKQFGFRNTHSTNHALISTTKEIRKPLDNNEYSCGVFLDFQKAVATNQWLFWAKTESDFCTLPLKTYLFQKFVLSKQL